MALRNADANFLSCPHPGKQTWETGFAMYGQEIEVWISQLLP